MDRSTELQKGTFDRLKYNSLTKNSRSADTEPDHFIGSLNPRKDEISKAIHGEIVDVEVADGVQEKERRGYSIKRCVKQTDALIVNSDNGLSNT